MITTPILRFGSVLTRFFSERLIQQKHVSPHTVCAYRDTFRLLLQFASVRVGKEPSDLRWEEIDAPLISAFLDDLQDRRGITARSRNLRLTAIRSLFRFAAFELPAQSEQIQRVLAIPCKRTGQRLVSYLTRVEVEALFAAPDRGTWSGRRDYAWLVLAVQTGVRVSELTGITRQDVHLDGGNYIHVLGKGRKERCTPLTKQTAALLREWMKEPMPADSQFLFPNREGKRLSNDGIQYLLAKHVAVARKHCSLLNTKRVSPHVLRHTSAMNLLQAGVDTTVIAMWLGHESIETTHVYLEADLALKQQMLAKTTPPGGESILYRPADSLLAFLQNL